MDKIINSRYQVIEVIGKGGFGEVYKIKDLYEHGRILALKKIRQQSLTEKAIETFKYEFKYLTTLRHPNLVKVYNFDIDKTTGELFFTMEFVEGFTLHKACRQKDFSTKKIENYLVQAARALSFIHSKGIIHYDIKPDNILINRNGVLKLMDFGFAGYKKDSKIRGTIQFMAPDFLLKKEITRRIDFFSLGSSFYYSISNKLPFKGRTKEEMIKNCIHGNYIRIEKLFEKFPQHIAEIINTLMQTDPLKRYSNASEIIDLINKYSKTKYEDFSPLGIKSYITSGKMVGRKREIKTLKNLAKKIFEFGTYHDNRPIFLIGRSGIGKSSILREFQYHIQLKDDLDYFPAYFFAGDDKPFQAFQTIIEEMIRIYRLTEEDINEISFIFNDGIETSSKDLHVELISNQNKHLIQAEKICDFFIKISHKHKFVIEVKSFEHANPISINILDYIIKKMRNNPELEIGFIFLATAHLKQKPYLKAFIYKNINDIIKFDINYLTLKETNEYIKELLVIKKFPERFIETIHSITLGNPYYINELFISLFHKGDISRRRGKWTIKSNFIEKLKSNLNEIIYFNFSKLEAIEQEFVKILIIIGRPLAHADIKLFSEINPNYSYEKSLEIIYSLCDNEIVEKVKYSDGFKYWIQKKAFIRVIIKHFNPKEYKSYNEKIAEFFEKKSRQEDNLYALSDYFYRSQNSKAHSLLLKAINKTYSENNYPLTIQYLHWLYRIEKDFDKKMNLAIAGLQLYLKQSRYHDALKQLRSIKNDESLQLGYRITLGLMKYQASFKTYDLESFNNAKDFLLKILTTRSLAKEEKARLFAWAGTHYKLRARYKEAIKYSKKAVSYNKSLKKNLTVGIIYNDLSGIFLLNKKISKALKYNQKACEIFEYYSDTNQLLLCLETKGNIEFYLDNYEAALECYEKALSMAKENNLLLNELRAAIKKVTVIKYSLDFEQTNLLLNNSYTSLKCLTDKELETSLKYELSLILTMTGKIDKALILASSTWKTLEKYKFEQKIIDFKTIELYLKIIIGKKLAEKELTDFVQYFITNENLIISEPEMLFKILIKIPEYQENNYKKLLKFIKNKLAIMPIAKQIETLVFLADFYSDNDLQKGGEYIEQAKNLFLANKNLGYNQHLKLKIDIYHNFINSYLGKHENAIESLSKLLLLIKTYKIPFLKSKANFYLGKIYHDLNSPKQEVYLKQALEEYSKINSQLDIIAKIKSMLGEE